MLNYRSPKLWLGIWLAWVALWLTANIFGPNPKWWGFFLIAIAIPIAIFGLYVSVKRIKPLEAVAVAMLGAIIGSVVLWSQMSKQYWEEKRWNKVVQTVEHHPKYFPKTLNRYFSKNKAFPELLDACTSEASNLLKLNDISATKPEPIGTANVWRNRGVLSVIAVDQNQVQYGFLCLMDNDLELKRIALVFPNLGPNAFAGTEMHASNLLMAEF